MSAEPAAFGRYLVRARLGEGGFGQVFLAEDPVLSRLVAVKVPRGPWWSDDDVLAEARALARLRHPYCVQVLDAGREAGRAFLVLEYVEGEDLETHLSRRRRPWEQGAVVLALRGPAEAIDHAHGEGILHRDLCPANLLVAAPPRGRSAGSLDLRVADFGLFALAERHGPSKTRPFGGDPRHVAPEAWRGSPDASSDVHSLASIAFRLLTGRPPVPGSGPEDWLAAAGRPERLRAREISPRIAPALDAALAAALSARRHERPPTATALVEGLAGALEEDASRRETVTEARGRIAARGRPQRLSCPTCRRPLSPRATECPFCPL